MLMRIQVLAREETWVGKAAIAWRWDYASLGVQTLLQIAMNRKGYEVSRRA
jgi:hypothetical protein